ncbi:DNA-directed DNA polymerase II small subunit [Halegenticoccus soli]|uniref:DNA-directed DNA polymerase II small subunit n=1 Tax=Halegenticoccus soli TaxID=1985678 RepID=UPI000C6D8521|nr:DNA-directed DNA polymerase II small subunit [Halegenticoccus soli]
MPLETPSRIVQELVRRGYNAEREAVTLLASAADPESALDRAVERAPDDALRLTVEHVRAALEADAGANADAEGASIGPAVQENRAAEGEAPAESPSTGREASASTASGESQTAETSAPTATNAEPSDATADSSAAATDSPTATADSPAPTVDSRAASADSPAATADPSASTGADRPESADFRQKVPVETEGSEAASERVHARNPKPAEIAGDVTGQSTGTGEYGQFVTTFRDRYERLSKLLRGRVNHRPAEAIAKMPGGSDAEMIGLVNDVRSTASGHWLVELEDTTGTFPCLVMKDKDIAELVDELLMDECIAVQGTLSDDAGILFVDAMHFPDVPRTHRPSTADRHVQAALISDVHVGSQEFMIDAWQRFTDWLHADEAETVEYLLIAGDMVEGVGVYPNQDEELSIVDIYDQYEAFSEYLKEVPGDMEIVMIPGNHDAVRLAEPQPGFDEELREIMSAHDARITGNPSTVTVEGVSVLMYHGVSLDEVIAELPGEKASYDEPHKAMYQLLKKRHVAPQYGGHMRLAPEEKDYLVVENVPDVFHTGHVHKLGWGKYHNVLAVNSGCWQAQTAFQKSVNIDPDSGYAPILDLDTLDMTVRKFA